MRDGHIDRLGGDSKTVLDHVLDDRPADGVIRRFGNRGVHPHGDGGSGQQRACHASVRFGFGLAAGRHRLRKRRRIPWRGEAWTRVRGS